MFKARFSTPKGDRWMTFKNYGYEEAFNKAKAIARKNKWGLPYFRSAYDDISRMG